MTTPIRTCSRCGCTADNLIEFHDRLLCPDCLDSMTEICVDCGTRFWNRECLTNDHGDPICPDCCDRNYTRCGSLISLDSCWYPYDNDDPYCSDCCSDIENSAIHDYYFKPRPIFYGTGPRFFGVELEIDGAGEDNENALALLNIANQKHSLAYCKHDGSLDDGFEIVTHPLSLECQLHEMPWDKVLHEAVSMGYLSHQAGTCGLHVHVSRRAFGDSYDAQDSAIARVLFFVECHWRELLRFSRRTQRQMDQWAARYGYRDQPHEMLEHVKKGSGSRYTCVNLTNGGTIEFRMFRGTLKLNTLLATLQMVDHICDVALYLSDDELWNRSWSSFVSGITNIYKYVGGKAVQPYGPRVKFWAPYASCALVFAPDLPAPVRQAILKVSPLILPISASAADRQLVVKLAVNELAYRSPDDVPVLRDASPVVRRFIRWLEKGDHAQRWVDAIRANGGGHSCSTAHGERELWISVLALITLFLDWAARKAELLTEEETAVLKKRFVDWLHPDGPQSPVDGAIDLTQPAVFYDFLLDYLRGNAARVVEEPGHADTVARIHIVNKTTASLTMPRAATFWAYAAGGEAQTDVDLQRGLMEAGVPLRTEGKDLSWRYAFYARGRAPQGQSDKLPCLSLPLAELPHEVLGKLAELFGDRFGSILPTTGENIAPEAKIGGKI